jgi:hypothetical protein
MLRQLSALRGWLVLRLLLLLLLLLRSLMVCLVRLLLDILMVALLLVMAHLHSPIKVLLHFLSLALNQIATDHPKILRSSLNVLSRFRALLQSLQKASNLGFVGEVRASSAVSEMRNATQTTMLNASQLDATPAHWVILIASRALMGRLAYSGVPPVPM